MIKKSLSIVLAALMTLSCMSAMLFTASAETYSPAGTGISSLSQITDLTGKYYLTADIGSASALSSAQVPSGFTGTLDGKDTSGTVHTIYTSVPVFAQLGAGATVKNLVIDGAIEETFTTATANLGALSPDTATSTTGVITLENITNNADITFGVSATSSTKAGPRVGGLIGNLCCAVKLDNCVNNGNITMTELTAATSSSIYVGGIVGIVDNDGQTIVSEYVGCENNGDILCDFEFGGRYLVVGGIIGYNYKGTGYKLNTCTNNGNITVTDYGTGYTASNAYKYRIGHVGGIIAYNAIETACEYINCKNTGDLIGARFMGGMTALQLSQAVTMKGCVNEGDISFIAYTATTGKKEVSVGGGMVGWPQLNSADAYMIFEDCINSGTISSAATHDSQWLGGIVGSATNSYYTSANSTAGTFTFVRCGNAGTVSSSDTTGYGGKIGGIFGLQSGSTAVKLNFVGCYNSGTVKGSANTGGIAGQLVGVCRFVSCVNAGTVTHTAGVKSSNFGGIIGACDSTTDTKINNCINKGTVSFKVGVVAGIVANANAATLINHCENMGTVERSDDATKITYPIAPVGDAKAVQENCHDRTGDNTGDTTVSLDFMGVQRSIATEGEETFSLRFVTEITDIQNYLSTGVMVYLTQSGAADVKYTVENTDTVYTQIGANVNGVNTAYPETVKEDTYYSALTVTNISVEGTYSFIVIPYTVDLDNNYAYADAYTVTVVDGGTPTCTAIVPASN